MAYDINFPADDSYLSDFPAGDREQNRALKDDQIVNAGRLRGLTVGNENGQIPINNGTENTNLNAALLMVKKVVILLQVIIPILLQLKVVMDI